MIKTVLSINNNQNNLFKFTQAYLKIITTLKSNNLFGWVVKVRINSWILKIYRKNKLNLEKIRNKFSKTIWDIRIWCKSKKNNNIFNITIKNDHQQNIFNQIKNSLVIFIMMNNFHNMDIQKVRFRPKKEIKHFITQHIYQIVLNNSLDQPKQRKETIFQQWT